MTIKPFKPTRRQFLGTGAAATALATTNIISAPAIASNKTVKFTLAWLAQGTSLYVYAAKGKGLFKKRGIDVQISRGYGSLASAQSIASGQFDFGVVIAPPLILSIAKGLPLTAIATVDYDATMGVGVLQDSPIRTAKDLVGKQVGGVPTSAEYPFFPAFLQRAGIAKADVPISHFDNQVLERALTEKQVAAIMGVGSSSLPVMLSKGIKARWLLYSSTGLRTYGQTIVTRPEIVQRDPQLCQAVSDALMEGIALTMRDPQEATDLLFKEVPEMALNSNGKQFIRVGLGIAHNTQVRPEAMQNGIGWGNPDVYREMIDLVAEYTGTPDMKKPSVEDVYSNRFVGNVKLSDAEWKAVETRSAEFGKLIG